VGRPVGHRGSWGPPIPRTRPTGLAPLSGSLGLGTTANRLPSSAALHGHLTLLLKLKCQAVIYDIMFNALAAL
jgi:hypothetical protein